ncbi:MAG: ABC transporter substrate-binding protein [Rhizobiales bacterium]|nr:ABC transporter substrate-binding protein [Hyphomicrobiales bacterium]MBN9010534.1 ABC transporter substrate-binding protein [Hyphomicrobiales bacterium]
MGVSLKAGLLAGWTAVSILAVTATGPAAAASLDLTIGALLESTGPLSELGPPHEKATKLAVEAANKAAKDAGFDATVTLTSADSQGDPQAALSAARTLVDKNAACIVGPATTPESISVLNGITLQRKISLWPTATSTRLRTVKDGGTIFRTVPADDLQAKALVLAIEKHIGKGKNVAIAYRNEPYGDALSKGFTKNWEDEGGKVVATVVYDPQQASFDSEAGQVVASNADAYVVIDYPETYAKFGAALVRTGKFDAKKLFVPDAMAFAKVPDSIPGEAINGAYGVAAGAPTGTESVALFNKLWDEAGGVPNTSLTANIFDATILCFLSSVEAGSAEPGAITGKVRSVTQEGAPQFTIANLGDAVKAASAGKPIDYVGVSGAFRFMENGDPSSSPYDVFQYQDGKQVTIEQVQVQ